MCPFESIVSSGVAVDNVAFDQFWKCFVPVILSIRSFFIIRFRADKPTQIRAYADSQKYLYAYAILQLQTALYTADLDNRDLKQTDAAAERRRSRSNHYSIESD